MNFQPPDPPEDPRDDSERLEDAFRAMEDERAEFEATFSDKNVGDFPMERTAKPYNEFDDYVSADTSLAWAGWLKGARVQWVAMP